ncbi:D-alanyl-D-alanine carboxypeptidase family protein [Novosphingobium pentaromativorans]|uniref:serine-type D-Ala-D-Ala carboxypeptidase n=1 Tax=Novosphingobium pentaromativorans US6-1 TaxID=1088721 RepID=G6EJ08_9SPHN|nr:D-alanyl-D-alanine carboxypeptidase family protein [Novosphingobium pentaromativorans]AIT78968.1 D-alanyl-D-alanine carboxypeptidase [Novosphingobium pentaromativorans US6-1]EHJ58767.1 D-alanyl-D-alanine carboxypeptidase (penicillin-binding protein 5/6) [Novosphingobium pentaromativorans US6-1]
MKSFLKFAVSSLVGASLLTAPAAARAPAPPAELNSIPVSLLVDIGSGQVLVQRRPDVPFLPASVTKVMTAFVAFEEIDAGRLALNRKFQVQPETSREWFAKGTTMYLTPDDHPTTKDLLHGIMTASANDASIVLAQGYAGSVAKWTARMNAAAKSLGMSRSHYNTPNGWMDEGHTYVTASDLVKLADAMITRHPQLYREFSGRKHYFWRDVSMRSHDPTVGVVPGADGIKTGYTREAGYNFLGTAQRDGRRLVMVLAGSPTHTVRDKAARDLLEWGFSQWHARHLFEQGQTVIEAKVQDGDAREVPLVANREVHATLPNGEGNQPISLSVHYRGPLQAPLRKGEQVGELEIKVGDLAPGRIPLYAGRDVGKAGALDRLVNGIINIFS